MLSAGMFAAFAVSTARRSRGLKLGSPPPSRAATVISRISLVNMWPRFASFAAFLRLICAHLLCPAKAHHLPGDRSRSARTAYTVFALLCGKYNRLDRPDQRRRPAPD